MGVARCHAEPHAKGDASSRGGARCNWRVCSQTTQKCDFVAVRTLLNAC